MAKRERGLDGRVARRTAVSAITGPGEPIALPRGTVDTISEILRLDPAPVDEGSLDLDDAERASLSIIPAVRDVQLRCFRESRRADLVDDDPETIARREHEAEQARRVARWEAFVPPRYVDARIGMVLDRDREIGEELLAWLDEDPRPNIVVTGAVGTGKTFAVFAAVRPLVEAGVKVVYWSTGRLLQELRPGSSSTPDLLADLVRADVLILDDLGVEKVSEWTSEQLSIVVDDRYTNLRPIIVTTHDVGALGVSTRHRGRSRLLEGASMFLLDGKRFR